MNEANDAFPARRGGTTKTYVVPQYNHCAPSVPDTTHDRLCGHKGTASADVKMKIVS